MSSKKSFISVEDRPPKVLIIGENIIISELFENFSAHGCEVVVNNTLSPTTLKFDYIVQFGDLTREKAATNLLIDNGKFLFIDTGVEEINLGEVNFPIIRTGQLSFWNPKELTGKIFKTLFSSKKNNIQDLRKKPHFTPNIIRKTTKSTIPLPKSYPTDKQIQKEGVSYPLVSDKHFFSRKKIFFIFSLFSCLLMVVMAGGILYFSFSVKNIFSRLQKDFAAGDLQGTQTDLKKAKEKITQIKDVYLLISGIIPLENLSFWNDLGMLLSSTDKLLKTSNEVLSFSSEYKDVSGTNFAFLKNKITDLQYSINVAAKKTDSISLPFFPKENFSIFLKEASVKLSASQEFFPVVEKMFLGSTPKIYLILFQNNMELRPTGGFIGSFGLLTVDKGKILDFKIEDVYTADGQLKGHVDPPLPIRKYLNQPHFFLRDSNFDPDFAKSAATATFFLQKEMGTVVDGVIGVNLLTVQKALRILGPVRLNDFGGEEITSDNFFFKAHSYSQSDFFPGSTRKKDFLTASLNSILNKLNTLPSWQSFDFIPTVKELLDGKNILLFSQDQTLQHEIEGRGWAGRMIEVGCAKKVENCFPDYLSLNEANLGVNKANYFIDKTIEVEKEILKDGKITNTVTVSYENKATAEIYQGSFYTNFLRIFLPKDTVLEKVTLNNVELTESSLDREDYGEDKISVGMLIKIAPGNKAVVKAKYTLPRFFDSSFSSYQFFYQKQGGDKTAPIVLSVKYPENLKLAPANFKSTIGKENEIYYTTDTSFDRIFALERE